MWALHEVIGVGSHLPIAQPDEPIQHIRHGLELVEHQDHSEAVVAEFAEQPGQDRLAFEINPGEGFVHDQ